MAGRIPFTFKQVLGTLLPSFLEFIFHVSERRVVFVYPPKGTAKAVPARVHLTVFPFYYYAVEKQKLKFQFRIGTPPF